MAGCRHILPGLHVHLIVCDYQIKFRFIFFAKNEYLTIIPRARMGSESIAHEAEGLVGY